MYLTTTIVCLHMSCGNELPDTIRSQIIALKEAGFSYPEISVQLCVNSKTAHKVYLRWEEYRCISLCPKSGCPKSLDKHDLRRLKQYITTDRTTRRQPLGEIIVNQHLSVSTKTLHKYITKDLHLGCRIEHCKPFLSLAQKATHLEFTKKYIH